MTPKQIDAFCGKLPAATRTVQWEGVIVFKVGGKMFCLIAPEDHSVGRISFKSAPEHYDALSRSPGFRPAPYLARSRRHRRRAAEEEASRAPSPTESKIKTAIGSTPRGILRQRAQALTGQLAADLETAKIAPVAGPLSL